MTAPSFSSATSTTNDLSDEAFIVESAFERDLAAFASRLCRYRNAGASRAQCEATLRDTGLRLVDFADKPRLSGDHTIVGAVVSGTLWISYFFPRRLPGTPQRPLLSKMITEGSSFHVARDTDAMFSASPETWLVVRDDGLAAATDGLLPEATIAPDLDLSSSSDSELLDRIGDIDFDDVSHLVATARPVLAEIASRRNLLRKLVSNARTDPRFRDDCELLPEFYKYVLHRTRNDIRLRLHVFRPDADLHAHAHRWAMVSHVLSGPAMNKYYGIDRGIDSMPSEAKVSHRLQAGSCYAFADTLIHWFRGAPGSATLTLRGPTMRPSATEFRRSGTMSKFGAEANMETSMRMTADQFEYGIAHLKMTNVL